MLIISRWNIDAAAWDACVAASPQRIIYGYTWYLDAVLPAPNWKWAGIVVVDKTGAYQAVLPVPLRRKRVFGLIYAWVVYQPLFCQFLDIFNRDGRIDPAPFLTIMTQQFRYGSIINMRWKPVRPVEPRTLRQLSTHILDLSADYETIYRNYANDRKLNLRRAKAANWQVFKSTDPEPLLQLFRDNHADRISGGVADWAYAIFRSLLKELDKRDLAQILYAVRDDKVEAGALFVREGNRIIYLFNAASTVGRRDNARTLLIDQVICENAGCRYAGQPISFDFESPEKPSIRDFYKSFGAVEDTFWTWRWSRLNTFERMALKVKKRIK